MSIVLDLRAEDSGWVDQIPALERVCQRALDAASRVGGIDGEVSLLLTNDEDVRALNRDWRGIDKATDVRSFEAAPQDRPFLGDIALALGVSAKDALDNSVPLDQHLSHLLIHGYLHLIGHDHIEDTDADEMEALEVAALASLGWPDPYR